MNHRRPNPDEITPDDLFRPDGGSAAAYGAPLHEPEAQAASTQYLPPMPPLQQQPYAPQGAFPQQQTQQYGGYQQGGFQQGQGHDQGGYDQGQGYDQGGYDPYDDRGYDDDPHRNRPSMRTLTIAVVAACAVVGVGLGALLSGGSSTGTQAGKNQAKHGATAGANNTGDKAAQLAEAQKLGALLDTAASNRLAVINAVADVHHCQSLPQALQTLTAAAQDRANLVTQLGQLQVDALPSGAQLVAKLTAGWQASQQADQQYAAWVQESVGLCQKKHHPKSGGQESAAITSSGTASAAKKDAAALWNPIADANGLPQKSPIQL